MQLAIEIRNTYTYLKYQYQYRYRALRAIIVSKIPTLKFQYHTSLVANQ